MCNTFKVCECPESAVPTALHFTAFTVHQMTGKCGTVGAVLYGMHHAVPALAHVAVRAAQHSAKNAVVVRACSVGTAQFKLHTNFPRNFQKKLLSKEK